MVKGIIIPFDNLTEDEQVRLFLALHDFAWKELPDDKNLVILVNGGKKR